MKKIYAVIALAALIAAKETNTMLGRIGQAGSGFAPSARQALIRSGQQFPHGLGKQQPTLAQIRRFSGPSAGPRIIPPSVLPSSAQTLRATPWMQYFTETFNALRQNPAFAQRLRTALGMAGIGSAGAYALSQPEALSVFAEEVTSPESILLTKLTEFGAAPIGDYNLQDLIQTTAQTAAKEMDLSDIQEILANIDNESIKNSFKSELTTALNSEANHNIQANTVDSWKDLYNNTLPKLRSQDLLRQSTKELAKLISKDIRAVKNELENYQSPYQEGSADAILNFLNMFEKSPNPAEFLVALNTVISNDPMVAYHLGRYTRIMGGRNTKFFPPHKKLLNVLIAAYPKAYDDFNTSLSEGDPQFKDEFTRKNMENNPAFQAYLETTGEKHEPKSIWNLWGLLN